MRGDLQFGVTLRVHPKALVQILKWDKLRAFYGEDEMVKKMPSVEKRKRKPVAALR